MEIGLSLIYAIAFTLIHLFSKSMAFIKDTPRSRFLSIAGGIAVSYVFMHLLPDLNKHQDILEKFGDSGVFRLLENHVYLIALLGLTIFYGLEKMVKNSRNEMNQDKSNPGVFWIHISSFFLYNALIGYLLIREEFNGPWGMFFYFLALAVHFITNDHSLRKNHKVVYDRYGRWLLAIAILFGWAVGLFVELEEIYISLLTALLAGGVILNVLKEELPEERKSSFLAFFLGIVCYSALLMLA
ncbi:hypothetical protein [Ureibacillus aquaedulcis]|uniref:ZIP Zinc transporter n=1 Tax=Ureibacillus aquaedulcis TaxID=3058421 RepID=A0ABT8GNK5_9BACL|nr:hypothetical protein [Ureibacillus sp. BA0131]MDN4492996.1 hypothetical protein [Ureibacillus sp. BA0131]